MADTGSAVELIEAALERLISGPQFGVAVSGGGDSMAMLAIASDWSSRHGRSIYASTVDHGLRPEAASEAEMVSRFCRSRGIPHRTLTVPSLDGPGNLSAMAREARYAALAGWAAGIDPAMPVLTGHTMDDQAETVLMRLARGSGAEGLAGIDETHAWKGVNWLRPMLAVRRTDLRDWLQSQAISWVDDPTNEETRYDRVKARQALAALSPIGITVEGLAATAMRLRRQREVLEADCDRLRSVAAAEDGDDMVIDRNKLSEALEDTGMRLVADTLKQVGGNAYRPRFRSLEPLYRRLLSPETFRTTLANCIVSADKTRVRIAPERPKQA